MKIFTDLMKRIEMWLEKYPASYKCILFTLIFRPVLFLSCVYYITDSNYLVCHCRDYTSKGYLRLLLKIFLTPYYMVKYFFHGNISVDGREGLAFVLIAKNEGLYIKEWLDFHLKQGVSHFIIYDNDSTDNFHEVIMPYINAGQVTYETIKGTPRQHDAYNLAIKKYGHKFKYMGFIDADEFVYLRNTTGGVQVIYTSSLISL